MLLCSVAASVYSQPSISSVAVTNGDFQMVWPVGTGSQSQVQTSGQFLNWQYVWPPHAAAAAVGATSDVLTVSNDFQFYRVRYDMLATSPVPTTPGVYALSFASGGLARTFRLNIPSNYTGTVSAPLALILHGHGQTADSFAGLHPDLASRAQAAGMILVFPQSTINERGTGWINHDPDPGEPYVDDAQYLLDLLDHIAGTLNIDRRRVYAGGFSNGGQMVHYLGARTTNTFAAYAAVASSIGGSKGGTNIVYTPLPLEPRSILIVNATNDCQRPFWGGANESGALQPAAIEAADHWTTNDVCVDTPFVVSTTNIINSNSRPNYADDCPNVNPPPNTPWTNVVTRTTWIGCTNWTEVMFVELSDGGHLWPDANDNVGYDANDEVVGFFLRHCRDDATGATNSLVVPTTPGQYEFSLCDQGYWRKVRLMIPAGYTGASATPLVFVFHGGAETIADFSAQHPALYSKANTEGLILVMPQATDHPFSRDTLWGNKPFDRVVDDSSFVTNLLEQLDAALNLDRQRVYACGFSNGGSFTHHLGMTSNNLLASIASVCSMTGWADPDTGDLVVPPPSLEPMPVLMVRGDQDTRIPYDGGTNDAGNLTFSAQEDVDYWTNQNACTSSVITTLPAPNVTKSVYPNCDGTTEVQLIRVGGMPHTWPNAADGYNYNANVEVIDFLLTHARP